MKQVIITVSFVISVILAAGCNMASHSSAATTTATDDEVWAAIAPNMAEGAEASGVRPAADILSEKEILVKMAKIAAKEGYLHPDSWIYKNQPRLLNARIEMPILVHDLSVPLDDFYRAASYFLVAVDERGEALLEVYVQPDDSNNTDRPYGPIGVTEERDVPELAHHFINKREAQELIEGQFPGQAYQGPVAVSMRFENDPYSLTTISWYFTVGDAAARSTAGEYKEYLINATVFGYNELSGPVTAPGNRAAIDTKKSVPGFSFRGRMAQLEQPLYVFDKLQAMQEDRSAANNGGSPGPVRLIQTPLR